MSARYGHHDFPALDFCAEVAALQAEAARLALTPPPGQHRLPFPKELPGDDPRRPALISLLARISVALDFVPGAHLEAVIAKGELRKLAARWD